MGVKSRGGGRSLRHSAAFLLFWTGYLSLTACTQPGGNRLDPYPWITAVTDYCYGPGQHAEDAGTVQEQSAAFCGTTPGYVLLGGWGGYIAGAFDHHVPNLAGYDLAVYTQPGYGSEPGAVFVMADSNGNGLADETWYELPGSEAGASYGPGDSYLRDYRVTYTKPAGGNNIEWQDNQGGSGELVSDSGDSWWWDGYSGETIALTGVRLPLVKRETDSGWRDIPGRFAWGYAENYTSADGSDLTSLPFGDRMRGANRFDIAHAVDGSGRPVHLDSIRFIKIQSAVFQICGPLNEISTEISGAADIHALRAAGLIP